jgi:transposase
VGPGESTDQPAETRRQLRGCCRTSESQVGRSALVALQQDGWTLVIVKRGQRAFKITGLTWIVERSFAWLGRNRRMNQGYEYMVQTSETMIDLAAIRLMLNRLTRS